MDRYRKFDEIFRNYYHKLYCHAYSFLYNPESARDVVNDTFEVLWRNFSVSADNPNIGSYLYSVARHKCIDILRHQATHDRFADKSDALPLFSEDYDYTDYDSRIEFLKGRIDSLPPQTRNVFMLCRIDGYTYQEAADKLGISVNTVKTFLSRAMKTLREAYAIHN